MGPRLSEKIYRSIKEKIENGELDSRSFLSESQTAKEYGVSKAPVRDAFHLLCSQGYLISYPRKGYMVNLFSAEEINQIQIIRKEIEKLSVRLVIEHASDEEILSLRKFTQKESDAKHVAETNNSQFHMRLAEITKNQYLPNVLNELLSKASQSQMGTKSDLEKHNQIINALLARDKEKAIQCIEEDIAFL